MDLKKEYDYYNKLYFGNKLPQDMVVEWSSNIVDGTSGGCHPHGVLPCAQPYCQRGCKSSFIRISPILSMMECQSLCTLLHEMVHIKSLVGSRHLAYHGKIWQTEMRRLVRAGAFDDIW